MIPFLLITRLIAKLYDKLITGDYLWHKILLQ